MEIFHGILYDNIIKPQAKIGAENCKINEILIKLNFYRKVQMFAIYQSSINIPAGTVRYQTMILWYHYPSVVITGEAIRRVIKVAAPDLRA